MKKIGKILLNLLTYLVLGTLGMMFVLLLLWFGSFLGDMANLHKQAFACIAYLLFAILFGYLIKELLKSIKIK